ncbi:MAG: hypothetical protein RL309_86 [Verrucomicrobiota bacterium]
MDRRGFLTRSAGLLGASLLAGCHTRGAVAPTIRAITRGPKFHWRGYYDKLLFSPDDRFVLANEVDFEGRSPTLADSIRVGMVDTQDKDHWIDLGGSNAWNWQQGCMLQWVPGSDRDVAWNDREGGRFVTRVLDVKSGRTRTLPNPFYTFSPDGQTAFAPDFARIDVTRPGYGYATGAERDIWRLKPAPDDIGIWRMDVATGKQRLLFSLAEAAKIPFTGPAAAAFTPGSVHWFNHLLCNTDGTRLFFLHRWRNPGDKASFRTRALTIDVNGGKVHVMDPNGGTSHFVWRDPQHIFAWAWHPSHGERFYIYKDLSDEVTVVGKDAMPVNGHNTYLPNTNNEWVLNDTYPQGPAKLQRPYLYHIPTNRRIEVGAFPTVAAINGKEWRCDTHPSASRSGRQFCFDSAHASGRQVYVADIAQLLG